MRRLYEPEMTNPAAPRRRKPHPVERPRKSAVAASQEPALAFPLDLIGIRLELADCRFESDFGEVTARRKGHLLSAVSVEVDGDIATATVELRTSVRGGDGAAVVVDAHLKHRVEYRIKSPKADEAATRALVEHNAVFHAWPYWRALLSTLAAQAGHVDIFLPLLPAGSQRVSAKSDQ